jgi:hypothetical protein
MIHRHLTKVQAFDAMFVTALATAAYLHMEYVWLLYVICIMAAVSAFRIIADMSTWPDGIARELDFLARCIRDKHIK